MNKADLIDRIAAGCGISKTQAGSAIDTTVDSITGGNRERDLRTGFSIPLKLTPAGIVQFAMKPMWASEE